MKKGKLIILTGASSVGKSEIRDKLLEDETLDLHYSVSTTTRPKKDNEIEGKDYYFVSHEVFAQAVRQHDFLEFTEFGGYYYATSQQEVLTLVHQGHNVLMEVEAQGAAQIRLKLPSSVAIFIAPVTFEQLVNRIKSKYAGDETEIKQRVNKASVDVELSSQFSHVVYNDNPEVAVAYIKDIMNKMNENM